ncbi:MAG: glycoside hydrolase family 2 [Pseudomonadota bacterium]|nr:glycoside hydrolase family 2 [Pseudomonadota bacterium]
MDIVAADQWGYPRPQLRRAHWQCLNGTWNFAYDDELRGRVPADITIWPHRIEVPFAPECLRSNIHDTSFHRACWYQRDFEVDEPSMNGGALAGEHVVLHFGAVDYHAQVWVNDEFVAEHEGGHTPFSADITYALREGGRQRLTVRVTDDPFDLEKPRGKQDWRLEPHAIWYPRTTGIWQTVWLECVADAHVSSLRWTPNLERWEIALHALTAGALSDNLRLSVTLRVGSTVLASDEYGVVHHEVHRRIGLSDPGVDDFRNELLWSPERPTLIAADLQLKRDGIVIDEISSYTALRSISTQREKILLNGRSYGLRLVLDQGYWPDTLMTAPSDGAMRRDVELIKEMGFNGVRKHQKIENPRFLFWADVLGLLVWEEMPSAYRFTTLAINRMLREWTEVIERDRSHPCIIVWVPFNESWGVPDLNLVAAARDAVAALYHLTRTLDPTRLVIGNDGWESSATDIIGIHDYDPDPGHFRARYGPEVKPQELVDRRWAAGRILTLDGFPHRGQPICLTEFGGIALQDAAAAPSGQWGYTLAKDAIDLEQKITSLVEVVRTTAMFSGFCYTQLTDTFQESNGLLTADRHMKIPVDKIAAAVRGNAPLLPAL